MNIVIITPDIYPIQKGYGGRNPINLYEAFVRMGHHTELFFSVPDRELSEIDINELTRLFKAIRLHSIKFIPRDYDYVSPPYICDLKKIKKTFQNNDYDLIILNDYFWTLSFLSLILMGKKNRSRTIMVNHGIISPPTPLLRFLFRGFSIIVSRVLFTRFRGILSYSKRSHNDLFKLVSSGVKLYIHSSCIDSLQFTKDYAKSQSLSRSYLCERFGISGRFLFAIGVTSPHKGYVQLIRAFFRLQKEFPELFLLAAGQFTSYYENIKDLILGLKISKKVKFIGPIQDKEKFLLLRECSVFVIPSLSEGFGAGAMEADVLQLKVVATNTGAHHEILINNQFSKIVPPGNEDELYNGIRDLLLMEQEPQRTLNLDKLNSYSCESLASFIISVIK